ncbi:hypothetical protein [Spirosoma endophyticum]|uniref:Uncharacterized protein n=1 Tax=Spirosoma endophyticum TaxID=662367 RepID=A0A1I2H9U7_9BACT|nr:hypothetical protein [Spirosoma endophyticum]SFF26348.1 hypothetical protein SAMN05216167_13938 [Spirosoma endophyticum]
MLSEERTATAKLFYFILFMAVNGLSCVIIPFFLDYAHTYLNGSLIPNSLHWDDNNRLRTNQVGWFTAQVLIVLVEFIGLLWLLYRFSQRNTPIWLVDEPIQITRWVSWLVAAVVTVVSLFGRGGFLIWLVKQYVKAVVC